MSTDRLTQADIEGEQHGAMALERRREAATIALAANAATDLADLTEQEFERGIQRLQLRQMRMQKILAAALIDGAHYGNPKDGRGRTAFKKPILYQAGAQEIRNLLGLTIVQVRAADVVLTDDFVSVTAHMGIQSRTGQLLAVRSAACNTKEKRFKKFDGSGFTYGDPREVYHDCLAMAEKRAGNLLTMEASGATAFFANAEEMGEALDEETVITPWTEEEKRDCYQRAAAKGIGRKAFAELVGATLGRQDVGSGEDVARLIAAIDAAPAPHRPAHLGADGYEAKE